MKEPVGTIRKITTRDIAPGESTPNERVINVIDFERHSLVAKSGADAYISRLEKEVQSLHKSVEELSVLIEFINEITSLHDTEIMMSKIIEGALSAINAQYGTIALFDKNGNVGRTISYQDGPAEGIFSEQLNDLLITWVQRDKSPLTRNQIYFDVNSNDVNLLFPIKSYLCVPMLSQAKLIGCITVFKINDGSGFDRRNTELLSAIASLAAQMLEHSRLYEEEKSLLVMKEELKMAAVIQKELLPKHPPVVPGYELAASTNPAYTIGGDYYDFIPTGEHEVTVVVGDISGKGLPASLLMANLQATIRAKSVDGTCCSEVMRSTNKFLFRSTAREKFATLFYCRLDYQNNLLWHSNAGHNPALLFRAGNKEPLLFHANGIPLGLFDKSEYEDGYVQFSPGDVLVIYTDGITEAINHDQHEFGLKRLIKTAGDNTESSAPGMIEAIRTSISNYIDGDDYGDDATIVVIKRHD